MAAQGGNWSDEVIAAAFCVSSMQNDDRIRNIPLVDEDEGIASDDSSITTQMITKPQAEVQPVPLTSAKFSEIKPDDPQPQPLRKRISVKKTRPKSECPESAERVQRNLVGILLGWGLFRTKDAEGEEIKSLFGKSLIELLVQTKDSVPKIVSVCSSAIERHGMVDGIYRLSGIASSIKYLKLAFESTLHCTEEELELALCSPDFDWKLLATAETKDLNSLSLLRNSGRTKPDVHSISSLLKLYFRELPEPLCTFHLYNEFLDTARLPLELRLAAVREVVKKLPDEHYRTLEFLMFHLHRLSQHDKVTGMTPRNLSIVWAPNLLRIENEENIRKVATAKSLRDIGLQAVCTEFLIRYPDLIFCENPTVSGQNFELGILNNDNAFEVDIDKEIALRTRGKSIDLERPVSQGGQSEALKRISDRKKPQLSQPNLWSSVNSPDPKSQISVNNTTVKLRRAKSSSLAMHVNENKQENSKGLSRYQGFKQKFLHFARRDRTSTASTNHKSNANLNSVIHTVSNQPRSLIELSDRKKVQSALFFGNTRQLDSLPILGKMESKSVDWSKSKSFQLQDTFGSPALSASSSSDNSETDILSEVNTLKLSFDLEESEMMMMNCCLEEYGGNLSALENDSLSHSIYTPLSLPVTVDESWEDAKLSLQLAEPVISEKQSTKESNLTQKAKNSIGRNPSKRNHSRPQSQRFNIKLFGENGLFAKYGGEKSLEGAENANVPTGKQSRSFNLIKKAKPKNLPTQTAIGHRNLGQRTKPSRTSNASNSTATCYSNAFDNKSYAPLVYLTKADKNERRKDIGLPNMKKSPKDLDSKVKMLKTEEQPDTTYQNIMFKTKAGNSKGENLLYQNLAFSKDKKVNLEEQEATLGHKIYENLEVEPVAVYDNVVVTKHQGMLPSSRMSSKPATPNIKPEKLSKANVMISKSNTTGAFLTSLKPNDDSNLVFHDDDIYQKVKALRKSVQEVNELVESEKGKAQMVKKKKL